MANQRNINGMLTIGEVAQLLNVHINTVRRWSNQGILKAYRIGYRRDRRYQAEDITKFLSEEGNEAETIKKGSILDIRSNRG